MEQIFSKPRNSIFKLPGLSLLLVWALAGSTALRAQIAPTDFVITVKTDIGDPGIDARFRYFFNGEFDLYYESIPAGISGTWFDAHNITPPYQFPEPGTYRLAIKPKGTLPFHSIYPYNEDYSQRLLTVEQWGTVHWSTFVNAFSKCINLTISATDVPILTDVTDMQSMFAECTSLTSVPGIENWDVGQVEFMIGLFYECTSFNQPLNGWNVSRVINMFSMFFGATAFNQPLDNWVVDNVTNFGGMFYNASSFNQPLGSWNVGNATDLNSMFAGAASFNQPVNNWDVRNVTSMAYMFYNASSFNQSLGNWTLNNAVSFDNLYTGSAVDCANYSQTLIGWANNVVTPSGRSLTVPGFSYGPDAADARDFLVSNKSWTITGDEFDGACTVLPVTLVSFDAAGLESSTLLTWSTSAESNSDRFEVLRSADAKSWEPLGVVAATGESTTVINYRFQDQRPLNGINYYRLKMIDRAAGPLDGKFTFSQIRSVDSGSNLHLALYPNPASDRLLISDYNQVKSVTFFNITGVKLLESQHPDAQGIDISRLAPGLHTVRVSLANGALKTSKLIISR